VRCAKHQHAARRRRRELALQVVGNALRDHRGIWPRTDFGACTCAELITRATPATPAAAWRTRPPANGSWSNMPIATATPADGRYRRRGDSYVTTSGAIQISHHTGPKNNRLGHHRLAEPRVTRHDSSTTVHIASAIKYPDDDPPELRHLGCNAVRSGARRANQRGFD
jgi:hypothetical protein